MTGPRSNLATLLENLATQTRRRGRTGIDRCVFANYAWPNCRCCAGTRTWPRTLRRFSIDSDLSLYLAGEMTEAMQQIDLAVQLDPTVAEYRQARDLLRQKIDENSSNKE